MLQQLGLGCVLWLSAASAYGATHGELQAVNSIGSGTYSELTTDNKITVEGILLNRPECLLDGTARYNETTYDLGGQWQIYLQGEGTDHAGTAVWMGQCYGNLPWIQYNRYNDAAWQEELYRLNHDPNTGYAFCPGDRIAVTGLTKFYGGKTNINERHCTDPAYDVTIRLVKPAVGLPAAEDVTLAALKDDADVFLFDPCRLTGCEYYQGRLVRLHEVQFVNAALWAPNADMAVTDGVRTFPVKLGLGRGFTLYGNSLAAKFDVVGIMDQEGSNIGEYRIWVPDYNGGLVLGAGLGGGEVLAGDNNGDYRVDLQDLAVMATQWLSSLTGY